jgi:hypothetical protein
MDRAHGTWEENEKGIKSLVQNMKALKSVDGRTTLKGKKVAMRGLFSTAA